MITFAKNCFISMGSKESQDEICPYDAGLMTSKMTSKYESNLCNYQTTFGSPLKRCSNLQCHHNYRTCCSTGQSCRCSQRCYLSQRPRKYHQERHCSLQKRYRISQKHFGRQLQHSSLQSYRSFHTCYNMNRSCRRSLCSSRFPGFHKCCRA